MTDTTMTDVTVGKTFWRRVDDFMAIFVSAVVFGGGLTIPFALYLYAAFIR